jgi:hypothetical protein
MRSKSALLASLVVGLVWGMSPHKGFSQNSRVDWSAFSSGFAVPSSTTTVVKSSVGQVFVGTSQQANSVVESGFLVHPFLRGPLVGVPGEDLLPTVFALYQNYPNPFNPSTTIRYEIPKPAKVELHIYNILGQRVKTLVSEERLPGRYSIVWNGQTNNGMQVASGVYFYRLQAIDPASGSKLNYVATKKLMVVK